MHHTQISMPRHMRRAVAHLHAIEGQLVKLARHTTLRREEGMEALE